MAPRWRPSGSTEVASAVVVTLAVLDVRVVTVVADALVDVWPALLTLEILRSLRGCGRVGGGARLQGRGVPLGSASVHLRARVTSERSVAAKLPSAHR